MTPERARAIAASHMAGGGESYAVNAILAACRKDTEQIRSENTRLREALNDIVRRYEFRNELYVDDETCAGVLYDTARLALAAQEGER